MKLIVLLILILSCCEVYAQACPSPSFPFTKYIDGNRHVRCMKKLNDSYIQDGAEYIYNKDNELIGTNQFVNGVEQVVTKSRVDRPKTVAKNSNWKTFKLNGVSLEYPWWWEGNITKDVDPVSQFAYSKPLIDGIKQRLSNALINFKFDPVTDKYFIFYPRFSVYKISTKMSPKHHCGALLNSSRFSVRKYGKERVIKSSRTLLVDKCIAHEKGFHAQIVSAFITPKKIQTVTHFWIIKAFEGNILIVYSDLREMPERAKAVKNVIRSFKVL